MSNSATLSVDAMLDAARQETGLADFGSDEFIEPFQRLVKGIHEELPFNAMGEMVFKADVQRLLVNRLRVEQDIKRHPEILDEDVTDPIVILGLVRTGTTKLQRMLSADTQLQKLHFWKTQNPAPFPNADPSQPDPRIAAAHQAVAMLQQIAPEFMSAHPTMAEDADEDLLMMPMTFETLMLYMLNPSQQYYEWLKHRPLHHTYRYLARLLKYLQWQDGGGGGERGNRPWVLKTPVHIGNLDALLDVFPRATLVHCHRDVTEVMPSFCRLEEAGQRLKFANVDLQAMGPLMLAMWQTEMDKYLKLRQKRSGKLDILDVSYQQIHRDSMQVIRAVYQLAGRHLSDEAAQAMLAWERQHPKDQFGKNEYTLEKYGLTAESVRAAFKDYLDQFGEYTTG